MKYKFQYKMTAFDLWRLSMHNMYHSLAGLCNVIFTMALLFLFLRFFRSANPILMPILLLCWLWFPLVQPLIIYLDARKKVRKMAPDMVICFDEYGVHVETKDAVSNIGWKQIRNITHNPAMIVIRSDKKHGFILSNRILGEKREEFLKYINQMVN